METSLMVNDYPEPKEEKEHSVKLKLYVEAIVTVYGDDEESWDDQIREMSDRDKLETIDELEVEEYEVYD